MLTASQRFIAMHLECRAVGRSQRLEAEREPLVGCEFIDAPDACL
jgi:hypothetical protein